MSHKRNNQMRISHQCSNKKCNTMYLCEDFQKKDVIKLVVENLVLSPMGSWY